MNKKAFRFGEERISSSDLGVGRFELEILPLGDGMDSAKDRVFETPDAAICTENLSYSDNLLHNHCGKGIIDIMYQQQ